MKKNILMEVSVTKGSDKGIIHLKLSRELAREN